MKISGFSFVRNATRLYYPVKQSILSVLDLVDEFVITLGDCDPDDHTRSEIESIASPKIKIIDTVWDFDRYPHGTEYAHQTDMAKQRCSGDWLIYIQSDEVLHEKHHDEIRNACSEYLNDKRVDGFLFRYKHFWGDFDHYHVSHAWYPSEIRIIRNDPDIHSWNDAQSFRRINNFNGKDYAIKEGSGKLNVIPLNACMFHYGWVRPPDLMQHKRKEFVRAYRGAESAEKEHRDEKKYFDYGPLNQLKVFQGSHPMVMKDWIAGFHWAGKLQYEGKISSHRPKHKHEKLKYRILTFLEQKLLSGRRIGGFKNYHIIRPRKS